MLKWAARMARLPMSNQPLYPFHPYFSQLALRSSSNTLLIEESFRGLMVAITDFGSSHAATLPNIGLPEFSSA